MFNGWFGKQDEVDVRLSGSEKNGSGVTRSTEHNEHVKRMLGPVQVAAPAQGSRKPATPPTPPPFEQIYQAAVVKPPKLVYGIQKVGEMGNSTHLAGMAPAMKRKALLMALEAAGIDVGEVLSDVVTRQRALKEYEESYLEKVNQFESAQTEQNRLENAELEKITSQFRMRIKAGQDEVERWHKEFRDWQKSKQQELQRLTEAAALCVPQEKAEDEEEESDGKIMAIAQRANGTYR